MLLKNHQLSNELKAQGRSLSPGSEPWAVHQVREQKPPHIILFLIDSPHCPTAKQSLRSAHSHPAPLPLLGMPASFSCKLATLPPFSSLLRQLHSFIHLLFGSLNTYYVPGTIMCQRPY